MRTSIVIALAIVSSLAISACGNHSKGSSKAKVAAAKLTNNKEKQAGNVDEINQKIAGIKAQLKDLRYDGLDTVPTQSTFNEFFNRYSKEEISKIKELLGEVKGQAEQLTKAGDDLQGAKNEEQIAKGKQASKEGNTLKEKAMKNIESFNSSGK